MRLLFFAILLAVMPFFASAQQLYGAGVGYVNGVPTFTPNISQKASELCVSLNRKMLYLWNRDSSEWKPIGGITVSYGAPIAAPETLGGTRTSINMQNGLIYWWNGTAWKEIISYSVELANVYSVAVAELYANQVRAELADSMVVAREYADSLHLADNDRDSTNELQNLVLLGTVLNITDGNAVDFASLFASYLLKSDTATLVATRYYTKTNPTTISANAVVKSNGYNLVAGNITENGSRVVMGLPTQLKEYSLAGLPTGTTKDMYWITGAGPAWYQGARVAYALESSASTFTSGSLIFAGSTGQATQNNARLNWDNVNNALTVNSGYLNIQSPPTGINSGIRMTSSNTAGLAYLSVTMQPSNSATTQFFATNNAYPGYGVVTNNCFGLYHSAVGGMAVQLENPAASIRFGVGFLGIYEKLRIDINGVGVLTAPTQELDVNGDLRVRDSLRLPILSSILQTDASGWVKSLTVTGGLTYASGILRTNIDTSSYIKGLGTIGTIPIFSGNRVISDSKMVYTSGTKQIKYTGADFFVEDSINGGVTLQVKNKAQGANVTTGLVVYNQSDDYAVFGVSSNGYNPGGAIGSNRGYIYTEAGRGFLMYSLVDTSRLMFKVGGGGGREMYLTSVGLGINRIATNSMLEVAGNGEFHGNSGINYIGAYGATPPDLSVLNTGYIYNTNTRFGIFSGQGFSVFDDIILHATSTQKVSIRAINDTLPGIGISLSKATFIRERLIIAPDSTFKFDPTTDLLQVSKYGTNATNANATTKTESGRVAAFATDGTIVSSQIIRDTLVAVNTNFSVLTLINTCQRLHITTSLNIFAPNDVTVTLPTPSATLRGKQVTVYNESDASASYLLIIAANSGNELHYTANTSSTAPTDQPSLHLDGTTWPQQGASYTFTCKLLGGGYRWVLEQR